MSSPAEALECPCKLTPVHRVPVDNFEHVQNSAWAAHGQALICGDALRASEGLPKAYSRAAGSHTDVDRSQADNVSDKHGRCT